MTTTPESVALLALAIEREHTLPITRGIDSTMNWAEEYAVALLTCYPTLAAALETDRLARAWYDHSAVNNVGGRAYNSSVAGATVPGMTLIDHLRATAAKP